VLFRNITYKLKFSKLRDEMCCNVVGYECTSVSEESAGSIVTDELNRYCCEKCGYGCKERVTEITVACKDR
jgi:hypothetical protein